MIRDNPKIEIDFFVRPVPVSDQIDYVIGFDLQLAR